MIRMAGQQEPILPLLLAASGLLHNTGVTPEEAAAGREELRQMDPALLGALGPFSRDARYGIEGGGGRA